MRLFLAEKPTVARTIAESLGSPQRSDGYITCTGNDIVTWCFGHLLEMAQPEHYNPQWGNRYDKRILPIVPDHITLVPRDDSGARKQISLIKNLLAQATEVVNAGDPDREGQLLVDEVLEYLKYTGPVKRIFLASLDPKSVNKALNRLEENAKYHPWRDAADTRRTVDWLGGINMSRAMTIFGNSLGLSGVLSLGRVQTPTLRLVVERDRTIANFVPVDYAHLSAPILHVKGTFKASFIPSEDTPGLDPEGRLLDFAEAERIRKDSSNRNGTIVLCERKKGKEYPKLPYSLATLQSDMGAKHNLGAQQVLTIAQTLYEKKLTSYPRTDCEYLPEEQFEQAPEVLRELSVVPALKQAIAGADATLKSKAWNSKKITAHHAIIPTGIVPHGLTDAEDKVYTAIALRYVLQFWPPMEFEATKIRVVLENQTTWEATGKCVRKPGWTAIVKPDKKAEEDLPLVAKNDPVTSGEVELIKKRTTPPQHFTEGTLITAMKNIHRFVDDKQARTKLRETSGLGTEATRAGIIEILKKREYIVLKDNKLFSTRKGEHVIDLCPNSMKDIVTTAALEDILSDIQAGTKHAQSAVTTYVTMLSPMIAEVFAQGEQTLSDVTYEHCPFCNRALHRVKSKKTETFLWICTNCRATFTDNQGAVGTHIVHGEVSATHTCPVCQKPLARFQRKDGSGFFWGCTDYPKCRWTAPDEDGHPGHPDQEISQTDKCPRCGSPAVRHRRKDGSAYFWGCSHFPDCKWTAPDENGKPGAPLRELFPNYLCPQCKKPLARIKNRAGGFFWGCTGYPACKWSGKDQNGQPPAEILAGILKDTPDSPSTPN